MDKGESVVFCAIIPSPSSHLGRLLWGGGLCVRHEMADDSASFMLEYDLVMQMNI